jgi:hypothetical protein
MPEPSDWPPRFTVTPEGAAGLFLRARCHDATGEDQQALADLLKAYWEGGYKAGKAAAGAADALHPELEGT